MSKTVYLRHHPVVVSDVDPVSGSGALGPDL